MKRLNLQPQASTDAYVAAAWYESKRPGLGVEFTLELDAAVERAAETPELYEKRYRQVRRVLLRRFPYAFVLLRDPQVILHLLGPVVSGAAGFEQHGGGFMLGEELGELGSGQATPVDNVVVMVSDRDLEDELLRDRRRWS